MRTTIDLPDDLHRAALDLARDRKETLSRTVSSLMRAALAGDVSEADTEIDEVTGLPTVRLGGRVTAEDVAAADHD